MQVLITPKFPVLNKFLNFWLEKLEGPLHSITVAHARLIKPDTTMNQITWQTQSLSEPTDAIDYFTERGIPLGRIGRDGAGSNWATYFFDPDGHHNELYYGIEQIGWNGRSKPAEYRRPEGNKIDLPRKSEFEEVMRRAGAWK